MADRKYFWLKLDRNFFKRHDIKVVESMENGKDYILFYLKLLVESITHEGELRFSETIPYDDKMLSVVTDTNIDIVRSAMQLFINLEMIEILEDKTIFMKEVEHLIGSETGSAERKRLQRAREKEKMLLESHKSVVECDIVTVGHEIVTESKSKNKNKSKSKSKSKSSTSVRFVKPTVDEIKAYVVELKEKLDAENFYDYYESNGWKVSGGKASMKDWKAAVRNWIRRDKEFTYGKKPIGVSRTTDLSDAGDEIYR